MTLKRYLSRVLVIGSLCAFGMGLIAPQLAGAQSLRTLPDFTDLVEQVGPSVVNIRTLEKAAVRDAQNGPQDEEMQEFFRRFFGVPMPAVWGRDLFCPAMASS